MIDNMFTGRKKNVAHWIGHPNFMLIVHDVVEPIMLEVRHIYPYERERGWVCMWELEVGHNPMRGTSLYDDDGCLDGWATRATYPCA